MFCEKCSVALKWASVSVREEKQYCYSCASTLLQECTECHDMKPPSDFPLCEHICWTCRFQAENHYEKIIVPSIQDLFLKVKKDNWRILDEKDFSRVKRLVKKTSFLEPGKTPSF